MFRRLVTPSKNSSFFIFGARGTGKSTFILKQFLHQSDSTQSIYLIDLLDPEIEDRFARRPKKLEEEPQHKVMEKFLISTKSPAKLVSTVKLCNLTFKS